MIYRVEISYIDEVILNATKSFFSYIIHDGNNHIIYYDTKEYVNCEDKCKSPVCKCYLTKIYVSIIYALIECIKKNITSVDVIVKGSNLTRNEINYLERLTETYKPTNIYCSEYNMIEKKIHSLFQNFKSITIGKD